MNILQLIKDTRERILGETQAEFAKRFNTHPNTVSRWESGKYKASYKVIEFVFNTYPPKTRIESLQDIIKIQCSPGNWDYDPYMQGLANGLLMAEHIILGKEGEVPFKSAPKEWGYERSERLKAQGWKPKVISEKDIPLKERKNEPL
jgi:transcriptional regulator with XRE-family HTH domain